MADSAAGRKDLAWVEPIGLAASRQEPEGVVPFPYQASEEGRCGGPGREGRGSSEEGLRDRAGPARLLRD